MAKLVCSEFKLVANANAKDSVILVDGKLLTNVKSCNVEIDVDNDTSSIVLEQVVGTNVELLLIKFNNEETL